MKTKLPFACGQTEVDDGDLSQIRQTKAYICTNCDFSCNCRCEDPNDPRVDKVCADSYYNGEVIVDDDNRDHVISEIREQVSICLSDEAIFSEFDLTCTEDSDYKLTYGKSRVIVNDDGNTYYFHIIYVPKGQIINDDNMFLITFVIMDPVRYAIEKGIIVCTEDAESYLLSSGDTGLDDIENDDSFYSDENDDSFYSDVT